MNVVVPVKLAAGWNVSPVPPPVITTTPFADCVTAEIVSVSPTSGAIESFASTAIAVGPAFFPTVAASATAVGASLTEVTVNVTVATFELSDPSLARYEKLSGPL